MIAHRLPLDAEHIRQMAESGMSDRLMAIQLDVAESTIRKRRYEAGIPCGNPGRGGSYPRGERIYQSRIPDFAEDTFADLMGDRRYEDDSRIRAGSGALPKPMPHRIADVSMYGSSMLHTAGSNGVHRSAGGGRS